ncbi:C39 family peptidase [Candidatus Shapirobacteria bacterium]|nr:C39 family peptidase [Candidatus Shapirobacteria bacterium]
MKKLLYILLVFVLFVLFVLSFSKYKSPINRQFEALQDTIVYPPAGGPSKILESGLPNKHLIETPFIPQAPEKNWDQPWQDACEEAAIITLDYYYQKITPTTSDLLTRYQQLFSYEAQNNWSHDINLTQMSQLSTQFLNYQTKIIDNPTIEDIRQYLSQDIPVIVPANGKTLYQENKRFKSGGPWYHNLVILGYDDNRQQFIVHDVGTQFGAYFKYSYSLLMSSIHDFPTSNKKEDIDLGEKRILILTQN